MTLQWARLQRLDVGLDFSMPGPSSADLLSSPETILRIAMRLCRRADVETDRGPPSIS